MINHAALDEIQRIIGYSKCLDPVALFYEQTDARNVFDDSHESGTKTAEELSAIAKIRLEKVAGDFAQLKFSLMVGAAERTKYRTEFLHEIGGITFAMDRRILELLHGYCLIFESGHFLFRGTDNTAHTLSSILSRSAK